MLRDRFVEVGDWYTENYKDSLKENKKDIINGEKSFWYVLQYLIF